VNPELAALLVVQQDDETIRDILARDAALAPRLVAMDKARRRALDEVARHEGALAREAERQKVLEGRMAEHRLRLEKTTAVLEHAHKVKEATAAMSQVETARRVLADDESEMLALTRRLQDLRTGTSAAQETLGRLDLEQADARRAVESERAQLASELEAARAKRATSAMVVGASLLSKYERVQQRRQAAALFALNAGYSCGNCDTSIPLQRRPAMSGGHTIEVCEACGVLLYLAPSP